MEEKDKKTQTNKPDDTKKPPKKPGDNKKSPKKPGDDFKRKYFEFYDDIKISDRQDW